MRPTASPPHRCGQRFPRRTAIPASAISGSSNGRIIVGSLLVQPCHDARIGVPDTVSASPCNNGSSSRRRAGSPPASKKSSISRDPAGMMSTRSGKREPTRSMSSSVSGTPTRPARASRWITALVDPPIADSTRMAFSNASIVRMLLGLQVLPDHLDDSPTGEVSESPASRVRSREGCTLRKRHPERLCHRRHRRRRPHRVAVPGAARHRRLGRDELLGAHQSGADVLAHAPHVGGGAEGLALVTPRQHRPTGQHDRREVNRRGAHQHRRRGLVAARQQHDAVERIASQRLLDVHRHQVAQQHRGRLDQGLAQRGHGELEWHAARFPDPALDVLGEVVEVLIAGREIGCRVADADHRLAGEHVVRQAALHPAAVDVVVA